MLVIRVILTLLHRQRHYALLYRLSVIRIDTALLTIVVKNRFFFIMTTLDFTKSAFILMKQVWCNPYNLTDSEKRLFDRFSPSARFRQSNKMSLYTFPYCHENRIDKLTIFKIDPKTSFFINTRKKIIEFRRDRYQTSAVAGLKV